MKKTRLLRTLEEVCSDIIGNIQSKRPKSGLALYREHLKTQSNIKFENYLLETAAMYSILPESEKEKFKSEAARLNPRRTRKVDVFK